MAGWMSHRHLHALFNPQKPEHKARPRMFSVFIAESNCGKSPFFKQCLDPIFLQRDEGSPPLVHSLASGFMTLGPGKDKTLLLRQCTNSDFARRMKATSRHLFWMGEEAWSCLDVAWATSKGKKEHSIHKVQHCFFAKHAERAELWSGQYSSRAIFCSNDKFCTFSCWSAQSHP